MYLKDSDECEILLRLIDDCDRLVESKAITGNAAFSIVSEAAKHHSDHPADKRRRLAEYDAKKAAVEPTPVEEPVPVPQAF
jgi:hypothetical protein